MAQPQKTRTPHPKLTLASEAEGTKHILWGQMDGGLLAWLLGDLVDTALSRCLVALHTEGRTFPQGRGIPRPRQGGAFTGVSIDIGKT